MPISEIKRESVARAICKACDEHPDHRGDARGNAFRWQDYLGAADAAIAAMGVADSVDQAVADEVVKAARATKLEPVACPRCGAQPDTTRVGANWRSRCASGHTLRPVLGHTMGTKTKAIQEWNREHGPKTV